MTINDAVLQSSEKIIFALRELYLSFGYRPYRMSKFEEYDLYAENKDFLVSDNVITFTDTSGKLMALKPDVTLSIIKNSVDAPKETQKVFYNENVYRVSKGTGSYKEIMQVGAECFGNIGVKEICESIVLAAESLNTLSQKAILTVSNISLLYAIVKSLDLTADKQAKVLSAIGEKNTHELELACVGAENKEQVKILKKLLSVSGTIKNVLPTLDQIFEDGAEEWAQFRTVLTTLTDTSIASMIRVDFSVIGDVNYYNGVVFKGFIKDIPAAVLSGGQYDPLMKKMGYKSKAIGFAVYTDALDRIDLKEEKTSDDGFVNIALPKGRLGEQIYGMFAKAGFECPELLNPKRKLIFENEKLGLRFFWVKPSDVAIYVERGAADIGVAGKDILLEGEPDVYELLDLKKGICRMAVAAPKGYVDNPELTLRVATKFSNIAKTYYQSKGRDIDIVHLNGSIEIAPILGLTDVIVDIVETGATLRENNLEVVEEVVPISARFIANKASYKFKKENIDNIAKGLASVTEE